MFFYDLNDYNNTNKYILQYVLGWNKSGEDQYKASRGREKEIRGKYHAVRSSRNSRLDTGTYIGTRHDISWHPVSLLWNLYSYTFEFIKQFTFVPFLNRFFYFIYYIFSNLPLNDLFLSFCLPFLFLKCVIFALDNERKSKECQIL